VAGVVLSLSVGGLTSFDHDHVSRGADVGGAGPGSLTGSWQVHHVRGLLDLDPCQVKLFAGPGTLGCCESGQL
jgi:hypothetical protein